MRGGAKAYMLLCLETKVMVLCKMSSLLFLLFWSSYMSSSLSFLVSLVFYPFSSPSPVISLFVLYFLLGFFFSFYEFGVLSLGIGVRENKNSLAGVLNENQQSLWLFFLFRVFLGFFVFPSFFSCSRLAYRWLFIESHHQLFLNMSLPS